MSRISMPTLSGWCNRSTAFWSSAASLSHRSPTGRCEPPPAAHLRQSPRWSPSARRRCLAGRPPWPLDSSASRRSVLHLHSPARSSVAMRLRSGRIPLVACQRRPVAFSIAGGALAFVLLLALGIYSPFLASHTSLDPLHLASELRAAFQKARDNLERTGSADFARAEALVDALKGVDRH